MADSIFTGSGTEMARSDMLNRIDGKLPAGNLMDDIYRHQRHIYDLTRKYYLLGRDRLVSGLDVPPGGSALELGCGTGRNLVVAARQYPDAQFFGIDLSGEMLKSAAAQLQRRGLDSRISLARADAGNFDPAALFGRTRFDRVFLSYSLSMIPSWQQAIEAGIAVRSPDGSLHVVDFGDMSGLPAWFRIALRHWLAAFHVQPRDAMRSVMAGMARERELTLQYEQLWRTYAQYAVLG